MVAFIFYFFVVFSSFTDSFCFQHSIHAISCLLIISQNWSHFSFHQSLMKEASTLSIYFHNYVSFLFPDVWKKELWFLNEIQRFWNSQAERELQSQAERELLPLPSILFMRAAVCASPLSSPPYSPSCQDLENIQKRAVSRIFLGN